MRAMLEEMDRIFSNAFGGHLNAAGVGGGLTIWSPAIEVSERDNQMLVCAELPGLKPEDVKVKITGDAVVIQGETQRGARINRKFGSTLNATTAIFTEPFRSRRALK